MREKEIHVMKNGPYRVIGGIKLFKESLVKKSNGEYAWEGRTLLAEKQGGLLPLSLWRLTKNAILRWQSSWY